MSYRESNPKPPSGPWHGALSTALIFGSAAWILVYTLLDVRPVEALGAWNYVGVLGLVVLNTIVGRTWRGTPYARPTHTSRL
ncbi:cell division protein CrgA [Cryptosporangium sp. NPDC051539]|uniref:cell division protein CrgA n=1 Tax=Cryptosporangium sp. NPDC051539 TaxID=3363962 RepID=UPI0037A624ED